MTRPTTEIDRAKAGYWNSDPVSVGNPGGMDESTDGTIAGHVDNFPAAVQAVGLMTQYVGETADTIAAQAFAVGGVILMAWDTGTADANPGPGNLRGNNATPSAVTALYASTTDADGADVSAYLTTWDDSTSTVRGTLRLAVLGDRSRRADFRVSGAIVTHAGYVTIPVGYVGSSAALVAGTLMAVGAIEKGDKGDPGNNTDPLAVKQGLHTIGIPAGALRARNTNGAAVGLVETTTNKVMRVSLDFDPATAQYAQTVIPMPKSANLAAGIKVQAVWTAASGSGAVVWAAQAQWQRDDDPTDGAWGTAQSITDTLLAAGDRHVSAISATITPAGTSGSGCDLLIQLYRDAANGSDTLAVNASLLGLRVLYTVNAADDT